MSILENWSKIFIVQTFIIYHTHMKNILLFIGVFLVSYLVAKYVPENISDFVLFWIAIAFVSYYTDKIDKIEKKLDKFDFEDIDENDWYYHQIINALDLHVQELQWKVTDLEDEIKKLKDKSKKATQK